MKQYDVKISHAALSDMEQIYSYIADRLLELYCTADVQTAQGVGIGASRKDVEAAYGTEYTQAGSTMTYALAAQDSLTIPASLYFELDGDTVCAIGLTSAHRAE